MLVPQMAAMMLLTPEERKALIAIGHTPQIDRVNALIREGGMSPETMWDFKAAIATS